MTESPSSQERDAARIEALKAEFNAHWEQIMADFIQNVQEKAPQDLRRLPKKLPDVRRVEQRFTDHLIEAFFRWDKEGNALVLWDLNVTIGDINEDLGPSTFGFRPSFLTLAAFLKSKFPDVKNGILSSWPSIASAFGSGKDLERAHAFFDQQHLYSAQAAPDTQSPSSMALIEEVARRLEEQGVPGELERFRKEKIAVLAQLRNEGLSPKVVDDDFYVLGLGSGAVCLGMDGIRAPAIADFCY